MNGLDPARRTIAAQLELGARGYASGAAEVLMESPVVKGAFSAWQEFYANRVLELSVGVLLDEPRLAGCGFAWASQGIGGRGGEPLPAALLLGSLRRSLEADLSGSAWATVEGVLGRAEAMIDSETTKPMARLKPDNGGMQTEALRFLERTLDGSWREAIDELVRLQRSGATTKELYEGVLLPAAVEMGTMWHLGEIGISEEHASTETILNAMGVLWHGATRREPNGRRVVIGSVTEDRHSLGVRATSWLLELEGYMAACLGSDLPAADFALAVRDYDAQGVVIGATLVSHLPRVGETVSTLRSERPGLKIVVGGPAFGLAAGLGEKLGADGTATSPGGAAELLDTLLA